MGLRSTLQGAASVGYKAERQPRSFVLRRFWGSVLRKTPQKTELRICGVPQPVSGCLFREERNAEATDGPKVMQMKHFEIGDRVKISQKALRENAARHVKTGTVIGYTQHDDCVRVRMDGKIVATSWHCSYLVPTRIPNTEKPSRGDGKRQ